MDVPLPDDEVSPLGMLNLARRAVPAVNYALGVAGIAAAGAIVTIFLGKTKVSIVLLGLILVGMVLLFAFSQLVVSKNRSNQIAGTFLLWAVLLFFTVFLVFTVTGFAAEWPKPWAVFLGIASTASPVSEADAKIAGGASEKKEVPMISGIWSSQLGDDLGIKISQSGYQISGTMGSITGYDPSIKYDHDMHGDWDSVNKRFDIALDRVSKNNGCKTRLLGHIIPRPPDALEWIIFRTDGLCELKPDYSEKRMWKRE